MFKDKVNQLSNLKILRVTKVRDLLPSLPNFSSQTFVLVQKAELEINTDKSPYLKKSKLWITPEMDNPFELKVKRSLALVNKSSNFLQAPEGPPLSGCQRIDG
ncbi:hypothetical protein PanWU01x14_303620 [Parasponia andersonii]|uniref:Phospholipase A1 n=1 Tax=Parasponia andersonii TaxID=3476 RepID=A0A2P5ASV1_PARAD|nr:hypothetical protein PanWU01x14_303620 [Parasponia andersonii]